MTIALIILMGVLIMGVCFLIGSNVSELTTAKSLMHEISTDDYSNEKTREIDKERCDRLISSLKHDIYYGIFCLVLLMVSFGGFIYFYRQEGMEGLQRGEYGCETVVKNRVRNGEKVKSDTTYVFYKIKEVD